MIFGRVLHPACLVVLLLCWDVSSSSAQDIGPVDLPACGNLKEDIPEELFNPLNEPLPELAETREHCGLGWDVRVPKTCAAVLEDREVSLDNGTRKCNIRDTKSCDTEDGSSSCCVKCDPEINSALKNHLAFGGAKSIAIVPWQKTGKPCEIANSPGRKVINQDEVFDEALTYAEISRCESNPADLSSKPGFIRYFADSNVLNPGASRATFGFFLRVEKDASTEIFFLLFSYDKLKDSCIFELFVFGPVRCQDGNVQEAPLKSGLAVDQNGKLVCEVPLVFANTANFLGGDAEPITPGLQNRNNSCAACHNGNGGDETFPFPWIPKPEVPQSPPAPSSTDQGTKTGIPVQQSVFGFNIEPQAALWSEVALEIDALKLPAASTYRGDGTFPFPWMPRTEVDRETKTGIPVQQSVFGFSIEPQTALWSEIALELDTLTLPAASIWGCTDSFAENYNANATIDDGTCYRPVYGCTDSSAANYVSSATYDDGSCQYSSGCTNLSDWYYDNGSCSFSTGVDLSVAD